MERTFNIGYSAIFSAYCIIYATACSFASVFMLAKGYSNSQIGLTMAASNLLSVTIQPFIADFTDRSKRLDSLEVAGLMVCCVMVFGGGLFVFGEGSVGLCISMALLLGFHNAAQPLLNSLVSKLERYGIAINFGVARAIGSLAYAAFSCVFGTVVERLSVDVIPTSTEFACILLLGCIAFTWRYYRKARNQFSQNNDAVDFVEESDEEINLIQFIRRNRVFSIMCLGIVGLHFSNSVINLYMAQLVSGVGGTTEDMGRILAVMAFTETPAMFLFKNLERKFTCKTLLKVCCIAFTLKMAIFWFAKSVLALYISHVFQPLAFGLFMPGLVSFTNGIMSGGEAVKGHALYTMMITSSTVLAGIFGGVILDAWEPRTLSMISTFATALGAAVIIIAIDKVKSGRKD